MKGYISRMTPRELFRQLVYMYINARRPVYYHPCISRGRSHMVASQVEDLFAFFLSLNLTGSYRFFVDQPLSYGRGRIYPDIVILKDQTTRHILDIKTDLGWNRDGFSDFCEKKQEDMQHFRGAEFSATCGTTKEKFRVRANANLHYHIVILSGLNISPEKLSNHLLNAAQLTNVHAYVLFPEHHPNYYGDDVEKFIDSVEINETDFNRIESALTGQLS